VPTYQYRCNECGKSFERTETITEHEAVRVRCPKCNGKKVTQVPGRVHVVTSKKARFVDPFLRTNDKLKVT
jgi:putative FmdB family regulatory protein